ncbi:MAG TPA: hypothetical protein VNO70_01370, partial [Blastocatellia bacterium]|nr:hypothetical protein [Blastocatellia bacterium]
MTLGIVVSVAIVYLATPTANYYWDGITFALQIEKVARGERGPALLFHQNHLLYSVIGYLFYRAAHAVGVGIRALDLLQLVNSVIGAIAVGACFRLAGQVTRNLYAAAIASLALAFSAVWWKLATDVNAYIPTLLLLLACAGNLLGLKPRWYVAGLLLAAAMLLHQLAALFFPAAVVAVFCNREINQKLKFALNMSLLAWGMTVSVYYACALTLRQITRPDDLLRWVTSNQSGVAPSLNPLPGVLLLPRANLDLIFGHNFALFRSQGGFIEVSLAIVALLMAVALLFLAARRAVLRSLFASLRRIAPEMRDGWKQTVPPLMVWIIAYVLFLLFWEPWQPYYRVFYAPALALLFALATCNYQYFRGGVLPKAATLGVAVLLFSNLAFFIVPHMRSTSNQLVAAALEARHSWNDHTVVYYAARNEADTTFEYFNEGVRWRRLSPAEVNDLDRVIAEIQSQGGSVWLNKGAAEMVGAEWLARRARG